MAFPGLPVVVLACWYALIRKRWRSLGTVRVGCSNMRSRERPQPQIAEPKYSIHAQANLQAQSAPAPTIKLLILCILILKAADITTALLSYPKLATIPHHPISMLG